MAACSCCSLLSCYGSAGLSAGLPAGLPAPALSAPAPALLRPPCGLLGLWYGCGALLPPCGALCSPAGLRGSALFAYHTGRPFAFCLCLRLPLKRGGAGLYACPPAAFSPKEGRGCVWACGAGLCSCYLPACVPLACLRALSCLPPSPLKRGGLRGSLLPAKIAYFVPFSAFAAALLNPIERRAGQPLGRLPLPCCGPICGPSLPSPALRLPSPLLLPS